MAASPRIKATNIIFKIGTTDYACDANLVQLTTQDAPGDVRSFCEVQVGQEWTLQLDGITSLDSDSLYQLLWANYGTEVAFTLAPGGNATPSADAPHYTGTAIFDKLPDVALSSGEVSKFSVTLTVKNDVHTPAATPPVYFGVTKKTSA
jgi:hypothetical protein